MGIYKSIGKKALPFLLAASLIGCGRTEDAEETKKYPPKETPPIAGFEVGYINKKASEVKVTIRGYDSGKNAGLESLVLEGQWEGEENKIIAKLPEDKQAEIDQEQSYGRQITELEYDASIKVPEKKIIRTLFLRTLPL